MFALDVFVSSGEGKTKEVPIYNNSGRSQDQRLQAIPRQSVQSQNQAEQAILQRRLGQISLLLFQHEQLRGSQRGQTRTEGVSRPRTPGAISSAGRENRDIRVAIQSHRHDHQGQDHGPDWTPTRRDPVQIRARDQGRGNTETDQPVHGQEGAEEGAEEDSRVEREGSQGRGEEDRGEEGRREEGLRGGCEF